MKVELAEKLREQFPQIFVDLWGEPHKTCMSFGVETGDGWYDLIYKLCQDIMALNPGPDFKAEQIKSKFGGLRFYISGSYGESSDKIYDLIVKAENDSYNICETCGSSDGVKSEGSWIRTLCEKCRK